MEKDPRRTAQMPAENEKEKAPVGTFSLND